MLNVESAAVDGGKRATWWRWLCVLAMSCVALAASTWVSPATAVHPFVGFVLAFVCVALATLLTSWSTPVTSTAMLGWCLVPLCALGFQKTFPQPGLLAALLVLPSLLAFGTLIGGAVGARVQAAGHLVFVACVSSAVDVFSVLAPSGPTAALIASPTAMSLLALPWPIFGTSDIVPILGVGDVVFASLYRSAARAHGLSSTRTWLALSGGFAFTLGALLWLQRPIPALPFLGLAFVVAHPAARAVPLADRKRGWIGAFALLVVLALIARYRP